MGLKKQVKLVRLGAKFQIAQVGTYSTSLPLLLEAHEIPGAGWNLKRQASVRLGSIRPASEVELRAKKAGAAAPCAYLTQTPLHSPLPSACSLLSRTKMPSSGPQR